MSGALLWTRDPHSSKWQLGPLPPPHGSLVLIGWNAQDDAETEATFDALSRAVVSIARVTFGHDEIDPPLTSEWARRGEHFVRKVDASSWNDWVRAASARLGFSQELGMISTRRASTAALLFDSGAFPWSLQGQVALFSDPDAPPPELSSRTFRDLAAEDWSTHAVALRGAGVLGVMRPGVDGDVAGVLSFDDALETALLRALEESARGLGLTCERLGEEEFSLRL